jgi:hypothetical protein
MSPSDGGVPPGRQSCLFSNFLNFKYNSEHFLSMDLSVIALGPDDRLSLRGDFPDRRQVANFTILSGKNNTSHCNTVLDLFGMNR